MTTDTANKAQSGDPADVALTDRDENYHRIPEHPVQGEFGSPVYNYSQPFVKNITTTELAAGVIVIVLWLAFFGAGLLIPTSEMRDAIWSGGTGSFFLTIGYVIGVGAGYTLTNVLFLCCFAAYLGGMAQRWQVGDGLEAIPPHAQCVAATRIYIAALLRGFFLYLMFLSGFLVVSTEKTVIDTELSQYIRIAGMISIVGFIVGYDPNLVLRLMQRILSIANLPTSGGATQDKTERAVEFKAPPK